MKKYWDFVAYKTMQTRFRVFEHELADGQRPKDFAYLKAKDTPEDAWEAINSAVDFLSYGEKA